MFVNNYYSTVTLYCDKFHVVKEAKETVHVLYFL